MIENKKAATTIRTPARTATGNLSQPVRASFIGGSTQRARRAMAPRPGERHNGRARGQLPPRTPDKNNRDLQPRCTVGPGREIDLRSPGPQRRLARGAGERHTLGADHVLGEHMGVLRCRQRARMLDIVEKLPGQSDEMSLVPEP